MTKLYEPACNGTDSILLNATDTAALLPYAALAKEIEGLLRDDDVQVPTRLVQALCVLGLEWLGASLQTVPPPRF